MQLDRPSTCKIFIYLLSKTAKGETGSLRAAQLQVTCQEEMRIEKQVTLRQSQVKGQTRGGSERRQLVWLPRGHTQKHC
jgi:hypothetical protein